MKEHFNSVNSILGGPANTGFVKINTPAREADGADDSRARIAKENEAFLSNPEDWYDSRMKQVELHHDAFIDDMDMDMAMESVNFITNLAKNPEGRAQMSMAHSKVKPQEVLQLFGMS